MEDRKRVFFHEVGHLIARQINYLYYNGPAVTNPLNCPLRISISSPDKSLLDIVAKFSTLTLKEKSDTIINYYLKV